jgi:VWFA-related protein
MRATLLLAALAIAPPAVLPAAAGHPDAAAITRTVYVTVTDNKGTPVTDLTAADFTVREGGRERDIVVAEPATTRMQLTLLVEQRLVGDGNVRTALYEFMKRMQWTADIALVTVALRNETVVDYTGDLNTLVAALNKLTLNPTPHSNLTEGVLDLARVIEKEKPERPVIVAVALSGGQSGGPSANAVLTQLRQSGATMHAVTLAGGGETDAAQGPAAMGDASGREQVLGDGSKQAGGRRHDVTTTAAIEKALQAVANDLLAQYVISYTLPDGTRPDRRLNVNVKRRGVTLRAPNAMPDR